MRGIRLALAAMTAAAIAPAASLAGVDMEVGNGDKITGTLSPSTEAETFRVRVPKGAKLTVKAKAAKKGPALHVVLDFPLAASLTADGKAASISAVASTSGLHAVTVTSQNGTTAGDYSLTISWKSPTTFTKTTDLANAQTDSLTFAADAGASATITAKPGKKSKATAVLDQLTAPDFTVTPYATASAKPALAAGGDYVLAFSNAGATQGPVTATVKVKPPKAGKRSLALTSKVIGSGDPKGDAAFAAVLGAEGGAVTVPSIAPGQPGAAISGSSVLIPSGALGTATSIVIATAPAITALGAQTGAGPTVFFGPEGAKFDAVTKTARATVTIPYDASYESATATFVVSTRDAKGKVTAVPGPYTIDHVHHTLTFQTSHFSSFRAASDPVTPTGPSMSTVANVVGAMDICIAHEPAAQPPRYSFFVATNFQRKVIGLKPQPAPSVNFDSEVFAGGGASNADGTPRLQFLFPGLSSIDAMADGTVFVASQSRIWKIGTDGNVSLFAGAATSGDGGDGGPATAATFSSIRGILADPLGNVYVADSFTHRVRLIDHTSLNINAWAGTGVQAIGPDNQPPATTTFFAPGHMAFAHDGGIYIADGPRVRRIDVTNGVNVTVAGDPGGAGGTVDNTGTLLAARFQIVYGLSALFDQATQKDVLAVTDDLTNAVFVLDQAADKVTRVAGIPGQQGNAPDAPSPPGAVTLPLGVALTEAGAFFVDSSNNKIRQARQ